MITTMPPCHHHATTTTMPPTVTTMPPCHHADLDVATLVSDGPLLPYTTNRSHRREDGGATPLYSSGGSTARERERERERDIPASPTLALPPGTKSLQGASSRYMSLPTK